MLIKIMKQQHAINKIFFIALILLLASSAFADTRLEKADTIKVGVRPLYGLIFGEFSSEYSHAPGFMAYTRGLFQLNISDILSIYPDVNFGFLYMSHKTEIGKRLLLFPFALNFYFDARVLNFDTDIGTFALKPFIGAGAYLNDYKSSRAKATGIDFGCQAGINLEYTHLNMKNFYVDLTVEHLFATNFKDYIPMVDISIGAGYAFEYGGGKTALRKIIKRQSLDEKSKLRQKYIDDLNSDEENKIVAAADWLGKQQERSIIPRLITLLLHDQRPKVRVHAAIAIGYIDERASLDPLLQSVQNDMNDDVRYTSLLSISRLRPTDKIMKSLKEFKTQTKDPYIIDYIDMMVKLFR